MEIKTIMSLTLIITLLALMNYAYANDAEDAAQTGNTYLKDKLNYAWENKITKKYKISDDSVTQAIELDYDSQTSDIKPHLSGAGGYYGDKD